MSLLNSSGLKGRKVILHDMCLRDGMHAKREQISIEQMVKVATALDAAGVPYIQVTHGAGLGGNSLQHGFAPHSNEEYISAVAPSMKQAKVSVLLIPGLGTMQELQSAYDCGARSVHIATHCTEADTSPHFRSRAELPHPVAGYCLSLGPGEIHHHHAAHMAFVLAVEGHRVQGYLGEDELSTPIN